MLLKKKCFYDLEKDSFIDFYHFSDHLVLQMLFYIHKQVKPYKSIEPLSFLYVAAGANHLRMTERQDKS